MVASYTTTDASNLETALKTSYVSTVRPAEHMQVGVNAGLFHINTLVRDVFLLHNSWLFVHCLKIVPMVDS